MSRAAVPDKARLDALGGGSFRVSGVMDASTVGELLARSEEFFVDEAQLSVDFSGVTEGDSAGLALLIEWLRAARQRGRPIHFQNIPAQINALARISEVGDLLAKTEAEPAGTAAQ